MVRAISEYELSFGLALDLYSGPRERFAILSDLEEQDMSAL